MFLSGDMNVNTRSVETVDVLDKGDAEGVNENVTTLWTSGMKVMNGRKVSMKVTGSIRNNTTSELSFFHMD